ncbi:peptide deformylase [Actinoplanes sp. CA-030573]|uniref:peptide deformylase n=1 Tax=Actinoplanes sp. CA-030573 TaxID=3239898 RepID=UPI003D90ED2D
MEPAVAFVLAPRTRRSVGMAFLVKGRTLMTCAHVVNTAIGRDPRESAPVPDQTRLQLWFPLLGSDADRVDRWATVIDWRPCAEIDFELADIALLQLGESVDSYAVTPLTLSMAPELAAGTAVSMSGPNPGGTAGLETTGEVMGTVAKHRLQIDEPGHKVAPGYSGGPVCDRQTGEVVAMVQAVPAVRTHADVYALSAPLLREVIAVLDTVPQQPAPRPGEGHVLDHAELHFDGKSYWLRQVRHLYNGGRTPIVSHEFKVAVEHAPYEDPDAKADYHRRNPLIPAARRADRLAVLEVEAWFTLVRPGVEQQGHPDLGVRTEIPHKRIEFVKPVADQQAEFRLLFPASTPLAPGAEAIVEYSYRVSARKWGQWFQRNTKPNTETLSVEVYLPARLHPEGWGMSLAPSNSVVTVLPGVTTRRAGDDIVFSWKGNADDEDLTASRRLRLEWFFWSQVPDSADCADAAAVLGRFGIRQVRKPARNQAESTYLHLPKASTVLGDSGQDRTIIRRTVAHLRKVAGWVGRFHQFDPAVSRGLAAPQLGMGFPIAIVSQPTGGDYDDELFRDGWLELVNPRIVAVSLEARTEFEGCLSFFDYRGKVTRPWGIRVEFDGSDGVLEFTGTLARSIHHELDHLRGMLFTHRHRMPELEQPIPVQQYRQLREPPPDSPQGDLNWRKARDGDG